MKHLLKYISENVLKNTFVVVQSCKEKHASKVIFLPKCLGKKLVRIIWMGALSNFGFWVNF